MCKTKCRAHAFTSDFANLENDKYLKIIYNTKSYETTRKWKSSSCRINLSNRLMHKLSGKMRNAKIN